jgi:hypothetical protein
VPRPSGEQGRERQAAARVTRKVYNLATRARVAKKRKVLDAWAIELRRIIGAPATELAFAA